MVITPTSAAAVLLPLSLLFLSISGSFAGFSQDAEPKAPTFLPTHKNSNLRKFLFHRTGTGTPISTVPTYYLFLDPIQGTELSEINSLHSLNEINVSTVAVIGTEESLVPSLALLKSMYTSLKFSNVKVSIMFSLSSVTNMVEHRNKNFDKITRFIKNSGSFMVIETSLDKDFVDLVTSIPKLDILLVLYMKGCNSNSSPQNQIPKFKLPLLHKRILGLLLNEHQNSKNLITITNSYHRDLIENPLKKPTKHDAFYATPITVPSTNPTPPTVTVLPTNPTTPTATISPLNPYPTPVTVPGSNPMPTTPVTNPVTTPATTNPVTTYPYPYPQPGTGTVPTTVPIYAPPVTMPGTTPVGTGTVPTTVPNSGQMWCVARSGVPDETLQTALDYACGIGGADCTALQPMGNCYNPNSVQSHASYAFNNYYQRNPSPTSCDFGGAGMLTNVNPSVGSCIFSTSSVATGYTPTTPTPTTTAPGLTPTNPTYGTGTGTGTGANTGIGPGTSVGTGVNSGSTALNSGSGSVFAPDSPTGTTSDSVRVKAIRMNLIFVFIFIYLSRRLW